MFVQALLTKQSEANSKRKIDMRVKCKLSQYMEVIFAKVAKNDSRKRATAKIKLSGRQAYVKI